VTVILVLQEKGKKEISRTIKVKTKKKETITDLFEDFWHSVWIGKTCYDINLWHEDRGLLKATLYKTNKVEGSKCLETDTSSYSSCRLRCIPWNEYKVDRNGIVKKMC
jgi:hypothetical protein